MAVRELLTSPERLSMMREHAARAGRPRAAQSIVERVFAELRAGVYA
jgi:hypothetical protein